MNSQDLRKFVSPVTVDKGVVTAGADVEFTIYNNSPYPVESWTSSCGCTGRPQILYDGKEVYCKMKADKGTADQSLILIDGVPHVPFTDNNGTKYFSPATSQFYQGTGEPVQATAFKFMQSITLYFDDGQPIKTVTEDGELKENPDKTRLVIPVTFFYI